MAYQKTAEEKKWQEWKAADEAQMRALGFDEQHILAMREYDREVFNSDRRYYQRVVELDEQTQLIAMPAPSAPVHSAEDFLHSIDRPDLHSLLSEVDGKTLEILLLRLDGMPIREIAKLCGLGEKAVYKRLEALKDRIRKEISL